MKKSLACGSFYICVRVMFSSFENYNLAGYKKINMSGGNVIRIKQSKRTAINRWYSMYYSRTGQSFNESCNFS